MAWRGHSAPDGQESPGLSLEVGRVPGAVLGLVWDRLGPVPRDLHAERLVGAARPCRESWATAKSGPGDSSWAGRRMLPGAKPGSAQTYPVTRL